MNQLRTTKHQTSGSPALSESWYKPGQPIWLLPISSVRSAKQMLLMNVLQLFEPPTLGLWLAFMESDNILISTEKQLQKRERCPLSSTEDWNFKSKGTGTPLEKITSCHPDRSHCCQGRWCQNPVTSLLGQACHRWWPSCRKMDHG